MIASCLIVSPKKSFWNDELYSYYLLADSSFLHMLRAFHDKINNAPPLYFLLGWLWSRMFGAGELSLRLFSCLGIGVAFSAVWVALRKTFSFTATSIGVLAAFCASPLVLAQNAEARMYGMFLASSAFGLLLYDSINRHRNPGGRLLVWNGIVHAAIVNTHLLGLIYSGAILGSHIVRDRYFRVRRTAVYLSISISWLSLAVYLPSFMNQVDAGNPRDWLVLPTAGDLIDVLAVSASSFSGGINRRQKAILVALLLIIVPALYRLFRAKTGRRTAEQVENEISLFVFACAFWLVPVLVWLLSYAVKPIFYDRYLFPSLFSRGIFVAFLVSQVTLFLDEGLKRAQVTSRFLRTVRQSVLLLILGVLLVQPINYALNQPGLRTPGAQDTLRGYPDLPIAMQYSHDFLERFYYAPERYFFILDWEAASVPIGGLFAPQEFKHLEAMKRNYPNVFGDHIITNEDFLRTHPRFLAMTFPNPDLRCGLERKSANVHCSRWFVMRVLNNPRYEVHDLGDAGGRKLWLVMSREQSVEIHGERE